MEKIGFKNMLLISITILVGLSVSITSYVSYISERQELITQVFKENSEYVRQQAKLIENKLAEKTLGFTKITTLYDGLTSAGTKEEFIKLLNTIAFSMNLNSAAIAFEDGKSYWNQTSDLWPDHSFIGDLEAQSYYQLGRSSSSVAVTEPYDDAGVYWTSIVHHIQNGVMSADIRLDFLSELVDSSNDMPGTVAFILNHDTTILASSSQDVETTMLATKYPWFKEIALGAVSKETSVQPYQSDGVDKLLFTHRIKVADKNWYYTLGLDTEVAYAKLAEEKKNSIISTFVAVLISVVLAFILLQIIYRPILALKETITGLSQGNGDLTQRLEVKSSDDLGQIADGINCFIASLQTMMLQIKDATTTLNTNVYRLKDQSAHNAVILDGHVNETVLIVAAIEEMDYTAGSIASDIANTAKLTYNANNAGDESKRTVAQSQETITELVTDVENSVVSVSDMSDRTEGISSILDVIGAIAEQTNLLALNAAIEAARAGEQGRGFAVVADEVRNLASRTKSSTEEIEKALTSLLQGNQSVEESMNITKVRCQQAAHGADKVAISLDTMTDIVSEINDLSTQVAAAAEEQSSVTQEIRKNMTAINNIVGELNKNGKQVVVEINSIDEINHQLTNIISRFKI